MGDGGTREMPDHGRRRAAALHLCSGRPCLAARLARRSTATTANRHADAATHCRRFAREGACVATRAAIA